MGGEAVKAMPPKSTPPCRILLVDDHADALSALQLFLEMSGHEVQQAADVEQALRLAKEWNPDVVFLDLNLSGQFDGLTLGETLRRTYPRLRLVALTGSMRQDVQERLMRAQFNGYLTKPVDIHELLPYCQC